MLKVHHIAYTLEQTTAFPSALRIEQVAPSFVFDHITMQMKGAQAYQETSTYIAKLTKVIYLRETWFSYYVIVSIQRIRHQHWRASIVLKLISLSCVSTL